MSKSKLKHIILTAVFLLTFAGIGTAKEASETKGAMPGHELHWGYEGEGDPEHWGDIKKEFELCKKGLNQSPINITDDSKAKTEPLELNYKESPLKIVNNGHTIQVNYAPGSFLKIGNSQYQLLQFHFHTPSEHLIKGKAYEMEVHFVHVNDKGQLAVVVGIFMKPGENNPLVKKIWAYLPKEVNKEEERANIAINVKDLLPKDTAYYNYPGSLTIPPCSEGINWFVMKTPIEVSKDQISVFRNQIKLNARPPQPINKRTVK